MRRLNKLLSRKGQWQTSIALIFLIPSLAACTQGSFSSGNPESSEQPLTEDAAPAILPGGDVIESEPEISPRSVVATRTEAESLIETQLPANFRGGYQVRSLAPNEANHLWLATRVPGEDTGIAQYVRLEGGEVQYRRTWTGIPAAGRGGTRTYVLEGGGVILAKQDGHLFFLHEGVPEGELSIATAQANGLYYQIPDFDSSARGCAVSYRRDGRRYIGVGYGDGMFIEFEQSNTPPYAPNFSQPGQPRKIHDQKWGYSCYIDQARLIYYAQDLRARTTTRALNLRNMSEISVAQAAPNAAFISNNLSGLTIGVTGNSDVAGSYAMAGDRMGNILNATSHYTMAHEPQTASIWASRGSNLSVYPQNCFYNQADCDGFASYDLSASPEAGGIGGGVGPLSALGDGHMVGLMRTVGDVYLFRLKDPNDFQGGIEAVKIVDDLGGDPYMYTDFTGATMYLNSSRNEFDFRGKSTWNESLPLRQLGFTWSVVEGYSDEWSDIRAEVRCYSDPENRGEFSDVAITTKAKVLQFIEVASCLNQKISHAELRLTQLNDKTTLMGVERVQLIAFQ